MQINVINKLATYKSDIFDIHMHKQDLALHDLQGLRCHKIQPTKMDQNHLNCSSRVTEWILFVIVNMQQIASEEQYMYEFDLLSHLAVAK